MRIVKYENYDVEVCDPPTVYGEICLCFDWDFPIEEISDMLGVQPARCGRRAEMWINPLNGERNPGFWEWSTEKITADDFSCDEIMEKMHDFISCHQDGLVKVVREYSGEVFLRLYIEAHDRDGFPGIRLTQPILNDAVMLGASIDIGAECHCPCEDTDLVHTD